MDCSQEPLLGEHSYQENMPWQTEANVESQADSGVQQDELNEEDEDADGNLAHHPVEVDIVDASGKPINQQSFRDVLINAELHLPQGESEQLARVVRRSVDADGKLIGTFNVVP